MKAKKEGAAVLRPYKDRKTDFTPVSAVWPVHRSGRYSDLPPKRRRTTPVEIQ
jgi:hypothetical protein